MKRCNEVVINGLNGSNCAICKYCNGYNGDNEIWGTGIYLNGHIG